MKRQIFPYSLDPTLSSQLEVCIGSDRMVRLQSDNWLMLEIRSDLACIAALRGGEGNCLGREGIKFLDIRN